MSANRRLNKKTQFNRKIENSVIHQAPGNGWYRVAMVQRFPWYRVFHGTVYVLWYRGNICLLAVWRGKLNMYIPINCIHYLKSKIIFVVVAVAVVATSAPRSDE